jgi:molecular chaperone GrpE
MTMSPEQEQRQAEGAPGGAPEAAAEETRPAAEAGAPPPQADGAQEQAAEGAEPADDGAAVEHDLDELVARAAKADEYLALAQRTQADFENYRKRMTRDVSAAETRGVARLARELLPALDNLARALAAVETTEDQPEHHLAAGIRLVHDELQAALARVGIEAFSPAGEKFDPQEHEAMAQQPVEGAESGTVVEVYQQGYRLEGAVLRPARVVVAA